ncbi:hypothetical protein [uncultured Desulfobacter sp.]|uniref:hypothetical protein n=1 Tax=uncultured Desulfobacter sp. TaxID=240139 RepID=UPI002AAB93C7|nr:hypothetical protein [uncultured Desulfobacter sp.]
MNFEKLLSKKYICLYAGDIPSLEMYKKFIGLSICKSDEHHIKHNIENRYPIKSNCVHIYQAEDVLEHIEMEKLPAIINEIYRILKTKGVFRLSLPDYQCDVLCKRSIKDEKGRIIFDPGGGGDFVNGRVIGGGHLWFPKFEEVKKLLHKTLFKKIRFYHYYDTTGYGVINPINYEIGVVRRTPDFDSRVQNPRRPLSIVVDCTK